MSITFSGRVYGEGSGTGNSAQKVSGATVRLYRKDTGAFESSCTSDDTGAWNISVDEVVESPFRYFAIAYTDDYEAGIVDIEKTFMTINYGIPGDLLDANTDLLKIELPDTTNNIVRKVVLKGAVAAESAGTVELRNDIWYQNWGYRQKITIDKDKVSTTDQTNFPILITEDNIKSGFWDNVKSDGSDIVVTSSNKNTKLSRELVSIDTDNETIELWVRIPTLSVTEDTVIYIYYGKSSASESNSTDVWDDNYVFVSHMEDNPDTSHINDSTSNGNDGDKKGANEPVETSSGKIGDAQSFDGNDDYINLTTILNSKLVRSKTFTISAWIKTSAVAQSYILANADSSSPYTGIEFYLNFGNLVFAMNQDGSKLVRKTSNNTINNNILRHVVITYAGNDATNLLLYTDGIVMAATTNYNNMDADATSITNLEIGARDGSNSVIDGVIDEVRISDTVRSVDWIATSYNNQNEPSTFYSVGNEESIDSNYIVIPVSMADTEVTGTGTLSTTGYYYLRSVSPCGLGDVKVQITYEFPGLLFPF